MFRGEMVAFGEALVRPQETKQQCRPTTRLSSYLVVALLLTALTLPAFRHAPAALGIVERGPASEPRVALTFDDGPVMFLIENKNRETNRGKVGKRGMYR
ncbi:MAG: hypothetical protein RDV00_05440 [Clostridia bacterium]|nr:hypothetical protein [Clostridia bacterium]